MQIKKLFGNLPISFLACKFALQIKNELKRNQDSLQQMRDRVMESDPQATAKALSLLAETVTMFSKLKSGEYDNGLVPTDGGAKVAKLAYERAGAFKDEVNVKLNGIH